jgi:hypothetical protein
MAGIFHQAPPLSDAAMFAEIAGDGLQRIELEVVRENPPRDALPGDLGRCGIERALELTWGSHTSRCHACH